MIVHFFPENFRFWNSHQEEVHFFLEEVHFFVWSLPEKVHIFQEDLLKLSFLEQPSGNAKRVQPVNVATLLMKQVFPLPVGPYTTNAPFLELSR